MERSRLGLAGSALGGLIAFAFVPAATAQWLPPWRAASPGEIERSLEAQGYVLTAPLVRRPGVYLADVSAGPAGYQRLVIDARSGQILERFIAPGRMWGPALAARDEGFGEPRPATPTAAGPRLLRPPATAPGEVGLRRSGRTCIFRPPSAHTAPGKRRPERNPSRSPFRPNTSPGDQTAGHQPASAASRSTRSGEAGRIGLASVQAGREA